MSNYFQTLNRLEKEKGTARASDESLLAEPLEQEPAATPVRPMPAPAAETDVRALVAEAEAQALADELAERARQAAAERASAAATPAPQTALGEVAPQRTALAKVTSDTAVVAPAAVERVVERFAEHADDAPTRRIRKQSLLDAKNRSGMPGQTPYATLFDNLRLMADGSPVRSIIVAGASAGDRADQVSSGLATLARRRGLRVLLADVQEGVQHPVLRPRNLALHEAMPGNGSRRRDVERARRKPYANTIALDLRGGPAPAELVEWFGSAQSAHDLVIVEAPSLAVSVDAAMLARTCDGLILVVDSEVTTKDGLCFAVERAQAVGCRVLGLVMNGTKRVMPDWMTRMTGTQADA